MIPHSKPSIGEEEVEAAARVLRSGKLAQGAEVEALEHECAAAVGRAYAVALNSGTTALHAALAAVGVDPGDPVGLPSYTCVALVTAVQMQRARPVLGDVGPDYNLDAGTLAEACRVIVVPHLFGAAASLPEGRHTVVEDIAQSMGGTTGKRGLVTVTSFYATKLMTTGEGGMVLTDDGSVAEFIRDRRDYDNRDDLKERYNYKMTDLQAAIGRVQLRKLPRFVARRREIAQRYTQAFKDLPMTLPEPNSHVFFRYVVSTDRRDALEKHLLDCGVEAKRPVHRPAHHFLGGSYPVSEQAHRNCLSLPIYPLLIDEDVQRVIVSLQQFFA